MRKFKRSGIVRPSVNTRSAQSVMLSSLFHRFLDVKRAEGLEPRTIHDYNVHFRYFTEYSGEIYSDHLDVALVRGYVQSMLERGLSKVTVNIRLRTMRAFLRYLYEEGYTDEPIHAHVKPIRQDEPEIEPLNPREIRNLLSVIDTETYVGFRDYTMILTFIDTMVRISELISIRRANVDIRAGAIRLDARHTKNRRARTVPISEKASEALSQYIAESNDFNSNTLFLSYEGEPILASTWRRRLANYVKDAGIQKRVTPHRLRHTGSLLYLLNGGDPFSLRLILGHSDMSMVKRYVNMAQTDVKRQHTSFSPLRDVRI